MFKDVELGHCAGATSLWVSFEIRTTITRVPIHLDVSCNNSAQEISVTYADY